MHLARDHQRVFRDAFRVTRRVRIACVDRVRERLERGEDDLLSVLEQSRVVDRDGRLRRELGDQVAVVGRERVGDLVVGEEEDPERLAAQPDRHAQHCARVERAVGLRVPLHRLHHRLARFHHSPTDLTAEPQSELLRRLVVCAESAFEHEPPAIFQGETSDLRRRCLGRARQHLLQHLAEI